MSIAFLLPLLIYHSEVWGPSLVEIRTTTTILPKGAPASDNYPTININVEDSGVTILQQARFPIQNWSHANVFRKWTHYCFSFNFFGNEAQVAYNGKTLKKIKNPKTSHVSYENQLGGPKTLENNNTSKFFFIFGRYFFDNTKVFAKYAGFKVWNRTLSEDEMKDLSSCEYVSENVNDSQNIYFQFPKTSDYVKKASFEEDELLCSKKKQELLIPMPILPVNKLDGVSLCKLFGDDGEMAGEFKSEEDFEVFYTTTRENTAFSDICAAEDAGRLKTWLPYNVNNISLIVSDKSKQELKLKYFTSWFLGPQSQNKQCIGAYLGNMLPYKGNIYSDLCSSLLCVVCKVQSSLEKTATIRLRGVCQFSSFDDIYQVTFEDKELKYYGLRRTVIFYNSSALAWQMTDVIDSSIRATFKSSFKTLGLGTHVWKILGDLRCQGDETVAKLSLTACTEDQFTCHQGLCIPLQNRSTNLYVKMFYKVNS